MVYSLGNARQSKIKLLQCYELLWIHNIDANCMIYCNFFSKNELIVILKKCFEYFSDTLNTV